MTHRLFMATALAAASVLAMAASAQAQAPQPGPMDGPGMGRGPAMGHGPAMAHGPGPRTEDFITAAAQSDEFERREGRLASTMARNPRLRRFGSMMVRAHTQTTQGLKMAIRQSGMTPPPPPPLRPDQEQMIAQLRSAGPEFDRVYVHQQLDAHHQALDLMQGYASNGRPGPIRDAAAKTAPLVQSHIDMLQGFRDRM